MLLQLIKKISLACLVVAQSSAIAVTPYKDALDIPAMQRVKPASSSMTAIVKAGERIVAVGRRGVIVTSDDSGTHWVQATSPVSVDLTGVFFTTPTKGWAVGHGGILLASENGGKSWERRLDGRQVALLIGKYYENYSDKDHAKSERISSAAKRFLADGPIHPFLDVWFENEKIGYIVGAFNLILRTTDGGINWTPWLDKIENPRELHIYSIRGSSGEIFAVGEQGLVLHQNKVDATFVAVGEPYRGSLFGLSVQNNSLIVYGLRGNVFRSTDLGRSWKTVAMPIQAAITGSTNLSDGQIALVSQGGNLLVSRDEGLTFILKRVEKPMSYAGVASVGNSMVALAGMTGIGTESIK